MGVKGCFVVDSGEDFGVFRCLWVEILKNAKGAKNECFGLVFRRVAFVSLMGPSGDARSSILADSCEDLAVFRCLVMEILKKSKKHDFGFAFRRFGFVSPGVPSGDV